MKVRRVCVSSGREVSYRGKKIMTGIFKEPVSGVVEVGTLGLAGDKQWDPRYHGGADKAVYTYAWEHYGWWKEQGQVLPGDGAAFGENLSTEGLDEAGVCLGDRLRFGTALLEAAEPRLPCYKLGIRLGDAKIVKRFSQAGRWGVYWRVLEEGRVKAGDPIAAVSREKTRVPIAALAELGSGRGDLADARKALKVAALSDGWREKLEALLTKGV